MNSPLVSVIVPTKNSSRTLEACLESIKKQTYQNIELIVVDNNSTDNTKEIAKKYTDKVFNLGPERSAQRNFGAKNSAGEYLLFIDSDMELSEMVIESCVDKAISDNTIKGIIIPEESFGEGFWAHCKKLERSFYVGISWMEGARFFDKKIFDEVGGYDEENTGTEDYDLPQRVEDKYRNDSISRVSDFIFHNEGKISLFKTCKKKFYYAQRLDNYKAKVENRNKFRKQSSLMARYGLFFSKLEKLFTNPVFGIGMLFMKTCEFVFGGMGYLFSKIHNNEKTDSVKADTQNDDWIEDFDLRKDILNDHNLLVSVILPTKNSAENLKKCLESIKSQKYKNIEIIVLIPKENQEFIELSSKYNFILLHCGDGKSASRNIGSEAASGEFLLHIDDDMMLEDGVILECVNLAIKNKCKAVAIREVEEESSGFYNKIRILEKIIVSSDIYIVAPRFIEKDTYQSLGGMDIRLDPIDEGDLKAKLEEKGLKYFTTSSSSSSSSLILSGVNSLSSLRVRWSRMYSRGQKTPLFNFLHPTSLQLKPLKRIKPYFKKANLLISKNFVGFSLIIIKVIDLAMLKIGSLNVSAVDKQIIADLKNKAIFEDEAGTYQQEFFEKTLGSRYVNNKEQELVKLYLDNIDKTSPIKILDIGSGGGRWSKLILESFPQAHVTACDLSAGMVKDLNQTFKNESRFKAVIGDMQDLPFEAGIFDLVISIRAIKYAQDQNEVFKEIRRVLKTNGSAIIELPYLNFIYQIIKKIKIFGKLSEYANRIKLYQKSDIIRKLKDNSFLIDEFDIKFSVPATLYKNINKLIFLKIINSLEHFLPRVIFGRSIFLKIVNYTEEIVENDLISIVVVNWNGKKWLEKCLSSLIAQTHKNLEVILVDNGSSDDSVEFIKSNYPEVILVKSDKNLGFAGGNNLGIDQSKGKYILLLNTDTWVDNNFVERIYHKFLSSKVDIIAPKEVNYEGEEFDYSDNKTIDIFGHPFFIKGKVKNSFYLKGVCLFFKRSLYDKTHGLDNNFFMYSEETDWFWRLNFLNKKFILVNDLYVYHAEAGSSMKGINYNIFLWRNQNALQMLLKNYAWHNLLWVLPIYFLQNVVEIMFFLLTLKPKIALSYVQGWWFNLINLKKILKKRSWVQRNRQVNDWEILKKMYLGFGKFYHLIHFYKNK